MQVNCATFPRGVLGRAVCSDGYLCKPTHEPSCPPSHFPLMGLHHPPGEGVLPHPVLPEPLGAALYSCCPTLYYLLPPSWMECNAALLGMQGYNSGHRFLSFPVSCSICGPERLEQPLDLFYIQPSRFWAVGARSSRLSQGDAHQRGRVLAASCCRRISCCGTCGCWEGGDGKITRAVGLVPEP